MNENRVALVLVAIKGIGKAIALDLAGRGFRVAATYHDWPESLPALKRDLAACGNEHLMLEIDLLA